eukprot:1459942-Alexandrium_andersonii.AAC.1
MNDLGAGLVLRDVEATAAEAWAPGHGALGPPSTQVVPHQRVVLAELLEVILFVLALGVRERRLVVG